MSHLTVAGSERAVVELFNVLRDNFSFADSDSASFGPFSASYSVALHLENGTVDLRDDNTIKISELDIKWDALQVGVGIDLPEICIGGWCIVPTPWGCAVRVPEVCVFDDNPDIGPSLDLSGLVTSELSVTASPVTRYFVDPARPPGASDIQAEVAGKSNMWQLFIDPQTVDVDIFDIADIVGDLLEEAVSDAVNALLPGPQWLKDLILEILGPIIDLIRDILDVPDDFQEWLSDLLNISFGLLDLIVTAVADYFAGETPLYEFEDPFPILPASGGLIPVKIPIRDLSVRVNSDELVLEADVGA